MPTPDSESSRRTRLTRTLLRISRGSIPLSLVQVMAGDRKHTREDRDRISGLRRRLGKLFFADTLFTLTHQYFPVEDAKRLWMDIIRHKSTLQETLGRNVGVSIAALDYLSNIRKLITKPVIVREPQLVELAETAIRDGLTGLFDHATFVSRVAYECARYERFREPFNVIMLDVDHFKKFNDTHGHRKGDSALKRIARFMNRELREIDVAGRYGGEEFSALLPHSEKSDGMRIADRIRGQVEKHFRTSTPLTVSLGVAACPEDGENPEDLLQNADEALYRSKKSGRNRVSAA